MVAIRIPVGTLLRISEEDQVRRSVAHDNQYVRPGPDAIHKEDKGVIDDTLGHRRASLSAIYV